MTPGAVQFPKIPGVAFPTRTQRAWQADYGPQFAQGIVTQEPPKLGAPFATLVPQVDRDGNEIGGIRMPEIQAPLGTYTGWNLRAPEIGAPDELYSMQGSWIPFARTRKDREQIGRSAALDRRALPEPRGVSGEVRGGRQVASRGGVPA